MNTSATQIRVGAVRYLNTKPLVYQLRALAPGVKLVFDLPSRLADRLAAGELDVALIPSIEIFHNPQYTVISDACIACRGPVWSVKLLSRVPMSDIRTMALDEGSRTSVALSRILLEERFGIRPQLQRLPIGDSAAATDADAVLLIGDRAIHPPEEKFAEVWDLGDQWCRWSELPLVFAMWAARPGIDASWLGQPLAAARNAGLQNLTQIAVEEAGAVGLTPDKCLHYLRDNLHFQLSGRERAGLQMFYEHAQRRGLAPPDIELNFADCATTT